MVIGRVRWSNGARSSPRSCWPFFGYALTSLPPCAPGSAPRARGGAGVRLGHALDHHDGDRRHADHRADPRRHGRGSRRPAVLGQPRGRAAHRRGFAFPVNRWLLARGKGHAVVHEYHHAHSAPARTGARRRGYCERGQRSRPGRPRRWCRRPSPAIDGTPAPCRVSRASARGHGFVGHFESTARGGQADGGRAPAGRRAAGGAGAVQRRRQSVRPGSAGRPGTGNPRAGRRVRPALRRRTTWAAPNMALPGRHAEEFIAMTTAQRGTPAAPKKKKKKRRRGTATPHRARPDGPRRPPSRSQLRRGGLPGLHAYPTWSMGGAGRPFATAGRGRWRTTARSAERKPRSRPRSCLVEEMRQRVARGPVRWELTFELAQDGDPTHDQLIAWPATPEDSTPARSTLPPTSTPTRPPVPTAWSSIRPTCPRASSLRRPLLAFRRRYTAPPTRHGHGRRSRSPPSSTALEIEVRPRGRASARQGR